MAFALESASAAELVAYEEQLEASSPGYLDQVRGLAGRLGVKDGAETDARAAVEAVEELALIDIVVPTASRRPAGKYVKVAIAKAVAWYFRYLGAQITVLGQSVAHMGATILARTESLEHQAADLHSQLSSLESRVTRLESGDPDRK